MVDCGATSRGLGLQSAGMLSAALGRTAERIEAVLITHFDADHWAGIFAFPALNGFPPSEVNLYFPHLLPRSEGGELQAAHLLFQAAQLNRSVTPIADIVDAWRAPGTKVRAIAVGRGSSFNAAGEDWDVHWPPLTSRVLSPEAQRDIAALEDEIRELAAANAPFREAIESVYEDWMAAADDNDQMVRTVESGLRRETESNAGVSVRGQSAKGVLAGLDLTPEERGWLSRRLSKFSNALSVVHSTAEVINFGDCWKAGLNALLGMQAFPGETLLLNSHYRIVLAPHHGTAAPGSKMASRFPKATKYLVSQNGLKHYARAQRELELRNFKALVSAPLARQIDLHHHGHLYASLWEK